MKKTTLILSLLIFLSLGLFAKSKTIDNPAYKFKNTGIYNVTKVELADTATFLTIHNTFIPHWWVQFDSTDYISDCETGLKYTVKDIQGAVFNQYLWMPDSGDSTIVLIFPPLPVTVKEFDFSEGIFGISLDGNQAGERKPSAVSPEIEKWMKAELAKAPKTVLNDFKSSNFFTDAPAHLIGCIKGYDSRAGFSIGIIYASNEFTRDDYPIVVKIESDGRFEAEIPMNTPKYTTVSVSDHFRFNLYLEPGQTLAMILDWDEFLTADRRRNIRYEFNQIEFRGPLASLNHELLAYPTRESDWKEFDKKRKTMAPMDFKVDQQKLLDNDLAQYVQYLNDHKISEKAQALLHNGLLINNYTRLFDYAMSRDYYSQQDTTNQILKMPIPVEYYDFLKQIDLNDQGLLVVNEFSSFINRFEYCELFQKAQIAINKKRSEQPQLKPEKSILEYFNEEKIELTDNERTFLALAGNNQLTDEEKATLKQMEETSKAFNEKYKNQFQKYADKYLAPLYEKTHGSREIETWKLKDSILRNDMGLEPNLIYEIAKVRSLKFSFKYTGSKDHATELWNFLQQGIKTPYLVATGSRLLQEAFPEGQFTSTPLPEGTATDIFRKIIDPFKGKVLFVDFWATTCGPCVGGIKRMKDTREKYAGNTDFDFIFITDERSSPEKAYTNLVQEQGLKNVYRLSKDDFNYLRQLFKFNGIPHYTVIDANGNVINNDFNMGSFESELIKILPQYKMQK